MRKSAIDCHLEIETCMSDQMHAGVLTCEATHKLPLCHPIFAHSHTPIYGRLVPICAALFAREEQRRVSLIESVAWGSEVADVGRNLVGGDEGEGELDEAGGFLEEEIVVKERRGALDACVL
jgi:hypothetical protein